MSVGESFGSGLRKALGSPALIFWVYLTSLVISLPVAWSMRTILEQSIGDSLAHEKLRGGFDLDWYGEFSFGRSGLGTTFGPQVVGILAVITNVESLLGGEILKANSAVLTGGTLFLLAWAFFSGGVIGRYAQLADRHRGASFFLESREYFFRFVRLLAISLLGYWAVIRWVAKPLHKWTEDATRDVTVETTTMTYTVMIYVLTAILLVIASIVLDYAKIAMVVEKRRSVLFAILRGLGFMLRNPLRTLGLYLVLVVAGSILLLVYGLVAPGPRQSGFVTVLLAFLVGQLFLVARITLKLWFLGSQTVLFQSLQQAGPIPPEPAASKFAA